MATDITFPLSFEPESCQYPPTATCAVCGKRVGEEPGFIRMTAGAVLFDDHTFMNGGPNALMGAILKLWYHGPSDARLRNAGATLDIIKILPGGQADVLFCSSKCVGSFFDRVVYELQQRIEDADHAFKKESRG